MADMPRAARMTVREEEGKGKERTAGFCCNGIGHAEPIDDRPRRRATDSAHHTAAAPSSGVAEAPKPRERRFVRVGCGMRTAPAGEGPLVRRGASPPGRTSMPGGTHSGRGEPKRSTVVRAGACAPSAPTRAGACAPSAARFPSERGAVLHEIESFSNPFLVAGPLVHTPACFHDALVLALFDRDLFDYAPPECVLALQFARAKTQLGVSREQVLSAEAAGLRFSAGKCFWRGAELPSEEEAAGTLVRLLVADRAGGGVIHLTTDGCSCDAKPEAWTLVPSRLIKTPRSAAEPDPHLRRELMWESFAQWVKVAFDLLLARSIASRHGGEVSLGGIPQPLLPVSPRTHFTPEGIGWPARAGCAVRGWAPSGAGLRTCTPVSFVFVHGP